MVDKPIKPRAVSKTKAPELQLTIRRGRRPSAVLPAPALVAMGQTPLAGGRNPNLR
jgi:hypothetical protein